MNTATAPAAHGGAPTPLGGVPGSTTTAPAAHGGAPTPLGGVPGNTATAPAANGGAPTPLGGVPGSTSTAPLGASDASATPLGSTGTSPDPSMALSLNTSPNGTFPGGVPQQPGVENGSGVPGQGYLPAKQPLPPIKLNVTPGEFVQPRLDSLLPETDVVIHVQMQRLLASPLTEQLVNMMRQQGDAPLEKFESEVGIPLTDIRSVTFAVTDVAETTRRQQAALSNGGAVQRNGSGSANSGGQPEMNVPQPPSVAVIQFRDGVSLDSIRPYQAAEVVTQGNVQYRRMPPPPAPNGQPSSPGKATAAAELDASTLIVGEEKVLVELLSRSKPWSPQVSQRYANSEFNHHFSILADMTRLKDAESPPENAAGAEQFKRLNELLKENATDMQIALDLGDRIEFSLATKTSSPESAGEVAGEIRNLLQQANGQLIAVGIFFPELKNSLDKLLQSAEVTSEGNLAAVSFGATQPEILKLAEEG
ncbi:MAG: hypothetical protein KDA66_19820, partial [Planctomycetaceae bacterium]|nr:hypothetical protein [Planctomycetaceae bacterium]